MMYVKFHENVVAICDKELVGKVFEDEKRCLNVNGRFYKGELMNKTEVLDIMRNAVNLNLVGKETISLALKEDLINKEEIILIAGIPHGQVYDIQQS